MMTQAAVLDRNYSDQLKSLEDSLLSIKSKLLDTQRIYKKIAGPNRTLLGWVFFLFSRYVYVWLAFITLLFAFFNGLNFFSQGAILWTAFLILVGPVRSKIFIPFILNELSKREGRLSADYANSKAAFEKLLESRLLPEIHRLGMATAQNVLEKTSAAILHKSTIIEILDEQVANGKMQRVPLVDDTLYKSLLSCSKGSVVETTTLISDDEELVFVTYSSDSCSTSPIELSGNDVAPLLATSSTILQEIPDAEYLAPVVAPTSSIQSTSSAKSRRQWVLKAILACVVVGGVGYWWTQKEAADERATLLARIQVEDERKLRLAQEQAQKEVESRTKQESAQAAAQAHDQEQRMQQIVSSRIDTASIPTRFGSLQIDQNQLLYRGEPLNPPIQGNNSLSPIGVYVVGDIDVLLLQDNGGTACPALYYFVSISVSSVKATPAFGTCSDSIEVQQISDKIIVTMSGFSGPWESETDPLKVTNERSVFSYENGFVSKGGKTIGVVQ